jgi:antitoxin component of MazEF toxin-antitoxin module
MSILEAIKPGYFEEFRLEEAQSFLEQCLACDSSNAEFYEFLGNIAQRHGINIDQVKSKLSEALQEFIILVELQQQLCITGSQIKELAERIPSDDSENKSKRSYVLEKKFLDMAFQKFIERVSEINYVQSRIVENYWNYLTDKLQNLILFGYIKELLSQKRYSLSEFGISQAICEKHQDSFLKFKSSLFHVLSGSDVNVRLPHLINKYEQIVSNNSDNNPSYQAKAPCKRYNLEDLLAKITPNNSHGESDWGEPIGKEVW